MFGLPEEQQGVIAAKRLRGRTIKPIAGALPGVVLPQAPAPVEPAPQAPPPGAPDNPFLEWVGRYRDEPVKFFEEVLQITPEEWQKDALNAIKAGERRLSIRSGHGVGKSTFASGAAAWFFLTRFTCKVVVTAPTASQLFDALFAELKSQLKRMPPMLQELFAVMTDRVTLLSAPDEVFISARTSRAEAPEALQGVHAEHVMLIADEASGVSERVFEAAVGSMSGHNAVTLLLGNPTQSSGLFYDTHNKLKDTWWTRRVSCLEVPNRVSRAYVEEVIDTYGEDSNAYRVRVLGEFPKGDDDTVIALEDIEAAKVREIEPGVSSRSVWGLDCARFGGDSTVLTKRKGNRLVSQDRRVKLDTMQVAGWVVDQWNATADRDKPVEICVDVIGIGSGVADRLRELGLPVVDVNVAEAPAFSDKYVNLRSELWFKGGEWFRERKCSIVGAAARLCDELAMVRYDFMSNGKRRVESKDDIRKRTRDRSSTDYADSFLLTFAGQALVSVAAGGSATAWNRPIRRNVSRTR